MMMKIRTEIAKKSPILQGIVETDETYIGVDAKRIKTERKMDPENVGVAQ